MAGDLVLLTGGTGMIGFKTLIKLLEAGYSVRAAVRNQAGFDKIPSLKPTANYKQKLSSVIVPDITIPGAYDEAVKGVKYVVHVASPLAGKSQGKDYEAAIIQPAIQGTVGILESANKTVGIERIVITASVASLASTARLSTGKIVDEQTHDVQTKGPFTNEFAAYSASKGLSFQATKDFVKEKKPSFDIISILPTFVIGRDDTVTDVSNIGKGTNGFVIGPILGQPRDNPMNGITVHVDDVAKLHVLSLDPKIKGNQAFLAAGPNYSAVVWADSFDIVRRHYPKEYAAGVFKFDLITPPVTVLAKVDNAKARKAFGIEFKSFEEQVVSLVDHFLELRGGT